MTSTELIGADLSAKARRIAVAFLRDLDAEWDRHVEAVGPCKLASTPGREPYETLIRAIAYQQLHAKAGDAILGRFMALYPDTSFPSPKQLLATDSETQRACGFSATKLETIRAIAQATLDGIVPNRAEAQHLPDETLIKRLTSIKGIGRWTVEMFLIYSLERSDILPVDDFGAREGYRRLKGLDKAPTPRAFQDIGQAWSPHRTVATWYLWRIPKK
jgi:DNA-3-methyladenine glycosylase II